MRDIEPDDFASTISQAGGEAMDRKRRRPFHWSRTLVSVAGLLLISIFLPTYCTAEVTFEKTYGGTDWDEGHSVQPTSDGGYVIAGWTASFGEGYGDVYLVRTDLSGDILWTKTYGGADSDLGYSVQQTADKGYIIAGWTHSFGSGNWDVYLIKTDSSGDTLWTRTYGGPNRDVAYSVRQTLDGGYVIAGWTDSFGAGELDVYLIKTDSLGDTLWTKTFGGDYWDVSFCVQQTSDGGYIAVGHTGSFGGHMGDAYLIKTDSLGDTLWTKTYGLYGDEGGHSVQQTSDGGYVIAGYGHSREKDVWLVKTDSSGNVVWARTYGGYADEWGKSVQQTSDGGYIVAGWTESLGQGIRSVYLVRTDSLGDTLWTRIYGGKGEDRATSVQLASDGGFIITGWTGSFGAGLFDVYLIKTDESGLVGVDNPRSLKEGVLAELDSLKPQSKGLAKKIKKAKKHIEKSLEEKRWLDETHLHHKHGKKVFYEEKKAVKDIKKLCKRGYFPDELCERLISMLVRADSILVRVAIDDAIAANGKPKEIEKAEKEMAKAEKDKNKGKYDKAIDHYKHAWQHAQKAMKKHKKQNQMMDERRSMSGTVLLQNHPNPCQEFTIINYQLPEPAHTTLRVYDTSGRLVGSLVDGSREAGHHIARWDGRDSSGNLAPSGVYFYQIKAGDYTAAKKLLLVR